MENNNSIIRALKGLNGDVLSSQLPDNKKNALLYLIRRLSSYYEKQYKELTKYGVENANIKELSYLNSIMLEYVIQVSNALIYDIDIFYMVNTIVNEITDEKKNGKIKGKRPI